MGQFKIIFLRKVLCWSWKHKRNTNINFDCQLANCQLVKCQLAKLSTGKLSTGKIVNWQIVNWQNVNWQIVIWQKCQLKKWSTGKIINHGKLSPGKVYLATCLPGNFVKWHNVIWQSVARQLCHMSKCQLAILSLGNVVTCQRATWQVETWQFYTGNSPLASTYKIQFWNMPNKVLATNSNIIIQISLQPLIFES